MTAFDISEERLRVATACGADTVWNSNTLQANGSSPSQVVLEVTRGAGAEIHIECAGAALHTMPEIERSFAPGGKMIYLGRTGEHAPVLLDVLVTQAAMITGSRGHAGMGCFPQIIRLLEAERLLVKPMITSRLPYTDVMAALNKSCSRTDGKIMLVRGLTQPNAEG